MSKISPGLEKFFNEYQNAFTALDIERQAQLFADVFISAGPNGVIAHNKAEFIKMAGQAAEYYKSVGQESVKILFLQETPVSDQYSLVKVHWGAKFRKTGDRLIEFDVSYIVQTVPEHKIVMFIAHQDEQKAMQELGLT